MRTSGSLGLLALAFGGGPWIWGCSQSPPDAVAASPEPQGILIDPDTTYQTVAGFGASVAWFQGTLVAHPLKDEIYEHIFAELGLDILRFRNRFERTDSNDGNLAEEVEILERATASLGHPPTVMLTSWAPSGPIKANGEERCEGNDDCTLRRDGGEFVYDEFATYWSDSLEHYATLGIVPDYVSIQNEPDFTPGSWEGCRFAPTETDLLPGYDRALEAVHARLSERDSPPELLGPETQGIHYSRVADYLAPLDTSLLGGVAHHLYEQGADGIWDWRLPGPDSYAREMRITANVAGGLPLFQTEFATDDDGFVEGGFETAWLIHNSMTEEGTAAFLYWDLVWPDGGLVALPGWDDEAYCPSDYCIRDQYYAVRHFSRFTDPGWVRVEATVFGALLSNVRASAYLSPDGDQLTVVLLNAGGVERTVPVDFGAFNGASAEVYRTIFRPGESETWQQLGALPETGEFVLAPRSVLTVVLRA